MTKNRKFWLAIVCVIFAFVIVSMTFALAFKGKPTDDFVSIAGTSLVAVTLATLGYHGANMLITRAAIKAREAPPKET